MPPRDPFAIRLSLALLSTIRFLVPSSVRADWMREWEAEIRYRWSALSRSRDPGWQDQADVVRRSTGAISDAAWLRQQFTADHDVMRDVRYALRMLRRRPAMSALAICVLALGIGGTVAVFSVVDTLLVRELPYRDADRIVTIWQTSAGNADEREGVAPGAFLDWRERATAFSSLAAVEPYSFDYLDASEPVTLIGALVTEGFLDALGVQPAMGRAFLPDEHTEGRDDVVLISHGAWQRLFAGDPAVVGRTVLLNERPHEVVGVLPRWFHPDMPDALREQEIWAPQVVEQFELENRRQRYWAAVARLGPAVGIDGARAELSTISAQLAREYPRTLGRMTATVVPFRTHLAGPIREPLRVLFGAVVLVLLIGCANVASLLLARAADRQQEFALRAAIGANRAQLVRQTLVESLTLTVLACLLGLAIADAAISAFVATASTTVPQLAELALDGRLVVLAAATSGAIAIVVGLWPALQLSRRAVREGLKEGAAGATASTHRRRFVSVVIVSEVALALVLLVTAGLLIRSFSTLVSVDPGFARSNVAVLQVFAYGEQYRTAEQRLTFFDRSLALMRGVPGVQRAGLVSAMPFISANIGIQGGLRIEGQPAPPDNELPVAYLTVATPDYFPAMDIPLRNGRLFTDGDHARSAPVAIINDLVAERFWPGQDPINQRITVNWQGRWRTMEIAGIVGRVRHDGFDRDARPEVFIPLAQLPFGSMTFVVRTSGDAAPLVPALRSRIWEVDPAMPLYDTATVDALLSRSLAPRRFVTDLLSLLAVLAFVLATLGIYGILSFSVAQRAREIGVRIAIGGSTRDILSLVFAESGRLVGVGLAGGLLGSLAATRVVAALLFETSPADPLTLLTTTALLAGVALLACYVPARRAAKVDPLVALRAE